MDIVDLLLSKIKVNAAGCFEWQGRRDKDGYGVLSVEGFVNRAHRHSYRAFRGTEPGRLLVCHHCDNPCCINPAHLFLGTVLDNARDCIAKGRYARGEGHSMSKLTDEQVVDLVEKYNSGFRVTDLSRDFGVSRRSVYLAVRGKTWTHVRRPGGCRKEGFVVDRAGSKNGHAKVTEEDVKLIRRQKMEGASMRELTERFGLKKSAIGLILQGKTWAHVK